MTSKNNCSKEERKKRNLPYLSELRVEDNKELVAVTIELAKAMRDDPKVWAIYERVTDKLDVTEDEMGVVSVFHAEYFRTKSMARPTDSSLAFQVLRQTAAGNFSAVDSDEAREYLLKNCKFW